MSMYRRALQNGVLVVQKRNLLRFWRWPFNQSEEDKLNRDLNALVKANDMQRALRRRIPKERARIKAIKDELLKAQMNGGKAVSPSWKDAWRPRKEPVVLIEDLREPKSKPDKGKKEPKAAPLFEVHQGNK